MTGPVLVIGDAFVDWIVRVSKYPPRAGNVWSSAPEQHAGGTATNVAVGLARLGIPVSFMGKVGNDLQGRFLLEDLAGEGVDTTHLHIDPSTYTPLVIAVVDGEGERTFFGCGREAAHTKIRLEEIDSETVAEAAWLHTSGICLIEGSSPNAILHAMTLAKAQGTYTSFDVNLRLDGDFFPEPYRMVVERAISLADVVLASVEEAALLAPASTIESSACALANSEGIVVVRLGAAGALAVSKAGMIPAPAFPTQVVDTLGAGDAFDAGFITACIKGLDVEAALQWGNAVAALKIARPGSHSLPRLGEVEQFMAAARQTPPEI